MVRMIVVVVKKKERKEGRKKEEKSKGLDDQKINLEIVTLMTRRSKAETVARIWKAPTATPHAKLRNALPRSSLRKCSARVT